MVVMTRLVIALPGLTVAIEKDDEPDPPSIRESIDVDAEELSAVHPKPLARTVPREERKKAGSR